MARKNTRRNSRQQNNGSSGFALLVIGFVLGVFVSVATYFAIGGPDQQTAGKKKPQQQAAQSNSEPELKFEFHSILPELEVVIPEQFTEKLREVLPEEKSATEQAATTTTPETPPQPSGETYFIQAGSFKKADDAERMKIKLLLLGLDVNVQAVNIEGVKYHRVRIGPLTSYSSFETARDRLKENGVQYMVLKSRG